MAGSTLHKSSQTISLYRDFFNTMQICPILMASCFISLIFIQVNYRVLSCDCIKCVSYCLCGVAFHSYKMHF